MTQFYDSIHITSLFIALFIAWQHQAITLYQCWFISNGVLCHSPKNNFTGRAWVSRYRFVKRECQGRNGNISNITIALCNIWKNVSAISYQLMSFSFHVISPSIPEIKLFQNLTLKIQEQGHSPKSHRWRSQSGSNFLSTHIPFFPYQATLPFLRYGYFKILPWKSKVKVIAEVKVPGNIMHPTSYGLTFLSFNVNRPFHS